MVFKWVLFGLIKKNLNSMKNPNAVSLGSLGGKARAKKYSKEQLREMGKKGGRPKK